MVATHLQHAAVVLAGGQGPLQLGGLLLGGPDAGAALAQLGRQALQPLPQLGLLLLRPTQGRPQPLRLQPEGAWEAWEMRGGGGEGDRRMWRKT